MVLWSRGHVSFSRRGKVTYDLVFVHSSVSETLGDNIHRVPLFSSLSLSFSAALYY